MPNPSDSVLRAARNNGTRALSADAGGGVREVVHLWEVQGEAGGTEKDQVAFYNLRDDVAKDANHLLISPTPGETGWNAASIARYVGDRPCALQNIHLTGASRDTLFDSLRLEFVRQEPHGSSAQQARYGQRHRHGNQFQQGIMDIPVPGEPLDGYTYPRIITGGTPAALAGAGTEQYTATMTVLESTDPRMLVPAAAALATVDPSA